MNSLALRLCRRYVRGSLTLIAYGNYAPPSANAFSLSLTSYTLFTISYTLYVISYTLFTISYSLKNIMSIKNFFSKKHLLKLSFILVAIFAFFAAFYFVSHRGKDRRVFIFPVSGSRRNQKEVRYLTENPVQGKIAYYIDELVLGPSFYRGRALFTPGTQVEYCFLRGTTLYVGLSPEAALQESGAVGIEEGVKLFTKNIKRNFTSIKNIELFIDGNCISD